MFNDGGGGRKAGGPRIGRIRPTCERDAEAELRKVFMDFPMDMVPEY